MSHSYWYAFTFSALYCLTCSYQYISCSPKWWWFFANHQPLLSSDTPSLSTMTQANPEPVPAPTITKAKSYCSVVVSYGHNSGHNCGLVTAKKCSNGVCLKHCPYKGGCDMHLLHSCHNATDALDMAQWIQPNIVAEEHNSIADEVHLPVPVPTPSELTS